MDLFEVPYGPPPRELLAQGMRDVCAALEAHASVKTRNVRHRLVMLRPETAGLKTAGPEAVVPGWTALGWGALVPPAVRLPRPRSRHVDFASPHLVKVPPYVLRRERL